MSPPPDPPNGGALVQLPCINTQWLKLLLGAADQLRNPATWDPSLTDAQRNAVIEQADLLRSMLAEQVGCVITVTGITYDCVNGLQYVTSDGLVHVAANGAEICACTTQCIVPPTPPIPPGVPINQRACNIAGFLASELIEKAMLLADAAITAGDNVTKYISEAVLAIPGLNPFLKVAAIALSDFFTSLLAELHSEVHTAATDPTLWSKVTCAIYNAIKTDGQVTSSNFSTIVSNIAGISYMFSWVAPLLSNFTNLIGVTILQNLQHIGAEGDVDCTDCGTWCIEYDFRLDANSWTVYPGVTGVSWVSGQGFVGSGNNAGGGVTRVNIVRGLGGPITFHWKAAKVVINGTTISGDFCINVYNGGIGGTLVGNWCIPPTSGSGGVVTAVCSGCADVTGDTAYFFIEIANSNPITVQSIQLTGNGPNPFGLDDCSY